uniref:Uncharacterized protein n=1 Tax=Rhizophora mucronata TaxID=61149 RepID=A0A2P2PM97_RHIMU
MNLFNVCFNLTLFSRIDDFLFYVVKTLS